ncbi:15828_t:CDS:2 [Funneliformis caledonium]|uniref:15828_t:CDS:1 n=1 Tax=Funneliformis caledonium TaxID=1117310 RepID=A0A9N9F4Q7_9GLOM|nr:15828_t:CDS:2 [Funneliformis caledonium]
MEQYLVNLVDDLDVSTDTSINKGKNLPMIADYMSEIFGKAIDLISISLDKLFINI